MFRLLPDTPDIYRAWKTLVGALGVIGKRVHDAPGWSPYAMRMRSRTC